MRRKMEIKDLILPETFDKEDALRELDEKYNTLFYKSDLHLPTGFLRENDNARNYVKELDEIENRNPVYDEEYWEKVKNELLKQQKQ